ncbi:FAD-dependent oxidoreductase [Nocardioides salsibiostraticola]
MGAGHAHLFLLKSAAELRDAGYDVTLLAPGTFHYSGVASATAAGVLPESDGQIDVKKLAGENGVLQHEGLLAALDHAGRVATTDDGTEIGYDVISFNIGSAVSPHGMRVGDDVMRVKPLSSLAGLDHRLSAQSTPARITVAGAGSSGVELAAHLALRSDVGEVTIVDAEGAIARDLPAGARRRLQRSLDQRGVRVLLSTPLAELSGRTGTCVDGTTIDHDVAILATGLAAPLIVESTGLGDRDGIPVRGTLQHRDHDDIYAGGDCANFLPQALPRVGVHGVRQGPVLLASLLARRFGQELPTYEPQAKALAILDLGGGIGLAVRGDRWWYGRSALWLKRWIDRRWLAKYQG